LLIHYGAINAHRRCKYDGTRAATIRRMSPLPPPFKSLRYAGRAPGLRLIVLGAVHGNETCGTRAIERVTAELDRGALALVAGSVSFVPVANPLAYAHGRRAGDRNLNRALLPTDHPRQFEDHVANWLCPLLAAHDVLLDLHSFQGGGQPFVMVGPRNNQGTLEPFALAQREEALARCLGVGRAVDGWLDTYAAGVARRRVAAAAEGRADALEMDPRYGIGTTEYMRSVGGCALTLECGSHDDPASVDVAYRAIRHSLAQLGLSGEPAPPAQRLQALSLVSVVDKHDAADAFVRDWRSFDTLQQGTPIGQRAGGELLRAAHDGWIVFPFAAAPPRQEWFYLARASQRFD
jgi:predicted deacylase